MPQLRQQAAIAAVAVGSILAVAGTAVIVTLIALGMQLVSSNQLHDTYFVLPSAWVTLLMFAIGVIADVAFLSRATRLGRRAALIWKTHLLFTTGSIIAWLVAGSVAEMTWPVLIIQLGVPPLILVAHGAALAAAGATVLRGSRQTTGIDVV